MISCSDTKELRLSYDLCDEEKDFLRKRKEIILERIQKIYGETKNPSYDQRNQNSEDFLQEPKVKKRERFPKMLDGSEAPTSVNEVRSQLNKLVQRAY